MTVVLVEAQPPNTQKIAPIASRFIESPHLAEAPQNRFMIDIVSQSCVDGLSSSGLGGLNRALLHVRSLASGAILATFPGDNQLVKPPLDVLAAVMVETG